MSDARGILGSGVYLPAWRLDRAEVANVLGRGGGTGTRSVACFDEDTTTMAAAAARAALRTGPEPSALWFATAEPAYLEKTNATAIHAACRLPSTVLAFDAGGAVRSGVGALVAACAGDDVAMVVSAGLRTGRPSSRDEVDGGDGAAAITVGPASAGPLIAEHLGSASATEEFVDRWRTPGERSNRQWEERFAETRYVPLAETAWKGALAAAGLTAGDADHLVVTGAHRRARTQVVRALGVDGLVDDLSSSIGHTGAAHPAILLASALDDAEAGQLIALVSLADGADVLLFRATGAVGAAARPAAVADLAGGGAPVRYADFLRWRGMLDIEPPNRPAPTRVSSSAAARNTDWKYGFVGAAGESGLVQLPPGRVSIRDTDAVDAMTPVPMADAVGTIVTFTIDKLVYTVGPPVVFAVVDFDGGGRLPIELTDVDPDAVAIGDRVVPTFRRLSTADGIHNYFWKARPAPAGA